MKASIIVSSLLLAGVTTAQAGFISSSADASLANASVLDFESSPEGVYQTFSQGGLTLSDPTGASSIWIDGQYAGDLNTRGQRSMHINQNRGETTDTLRIDFTLTASAFGFLWGASENQWSLSAFDGGNNLIESYLLPITTTSNAGDFVGIAATGIKYAILYTADGKGDWVFIDNITQATTAPTTVPIPAAAWLFGSALFGLGAVGTRKLKGTAA